MICEEDIKHVRKILGLFEKGEYQKVEGNEYGCGICNKKKSEEVIYFEFKKKLGESRFFYHKSCIENLVSNG